VQVRFQLVVYFLEDRSLERHRIGGEGKAMERKGSPARIKETL
jgi:hypothetical protein